MDDDSRAAELKLLTEDINSLNKLIEVQESKIKTYGSYLEPKVVKESKDSATPKTSETTAESSKEKTGFVSPANDLQPPTLNHVTAAISNDAIL